jgi:hypothetical protein
MLNVSQKLISRDLSFQKIPNPTPQPRELFLPRTPTSPPLNGLFIPNYPRKLTVPLGSVCKAEARASQPTMRAISCTRAFVSRALASLERSWESLARRQGWVDTWMLDGREDGEAEEDMLGRTKQIYVPAGCSIRTDIVSIGDGRRGLIMFQSER